MSNRKTLSILALSGGLLAGAAAPASGGVSTSFESVVVDKAAGDALFTIDFPHAPDFFKVDAAGRPADSFQVEITAGSNVNNFLNPTSVIRGDEIRFAQALRVRDAAPPDPDPHAGGWGAIRGTVPFSVNGDAVAFTAPFSLLGVPNSVFGYHIFTVADGVVQSEAFGNTQAVPLPTALSATLLTLGSGLTGMFLRRIRSK